MVLQLPNILQKSPSMYNLRNRNAFIEQSQQGLKSAKKLEKKPYQGLNNGFHTFYSVTILVSRGQTAFFSLSLGGEKKWSGPV